ncbi:MAG: phosphodiester glycosidase family protein [Halothece sp.]
MRKLNKFALQQSMKWDKRPRQIALGFTTVIACIVFATVSNAQQPSSSATILRQGEEISINGEKVPISWRQWQEEGNTYLGITDAAAQQRLGLELLSSNNPQVQPVWWFNGDNRSAYRLRAQHLGPNRYLDLTPILQQSTEQLAVFQNRLEITTPPAQVQNIRLGKQTWGERIVIDLDHPILWQMEEGRQQASFTLSASTPTRISQQFSPNPEITEARKQQTNQSLLAVKAAGKQTKLQIDLPESLNLRVSTLANPARLVIDLRRDDLRSRQIRWAEGILWRQDYIPVQDSEFAVTWLEIDPSFHQLDFQPIWHNPQNMRGIATLAQTSEQSQVSIAINGGFFNRDRKLPLGAIKQDGKWYSSPILNRGAIAWNDRGQLIMDRLRYEETLITETGNRFSLQALNSGYVQSGIARYTPAWGDTYTPLTDNEIIVVVDNEQVQRLQTGKFNQGQRIPIPADGYLLTLRKKPQLASMFKAGMELELQSQTIPSLFDRYPHILAAGPLLIKNQQVVLDAKGENFSNAFINQKAHRSAIALTGQGKILLVAMGDGVNRKGPTLSEATTILARLGAIEALNLDGGSSTSLYLSGELINRPPATAARVHNGLGIYLKD